MASPQNYISVSRRPPDVEDYIDILRRYRSWVIGPTFAGLVISVCVACWLPDVYLCYASMQIKPAAVSAELVPSVLSGHMADRLNQLRLQILSRDNLISHLQDPKLNLYPKERAKYPAEDVAERYFSKAIKIQPIALSSEGESRGAQAFRISFEYPDRIKAREVVTALVADFQGKSIEVRTQQATQQGNFLDDQVKNAKDKLTQAQADIANFSAENQGKLPENFQQNMMEVASKNTQIITLSDELAQEKQRQALLESDLTNNRSVQSGVMSNLTTTVTSNNPVVKNQNLINLETAVYTKSNECVGLRRTYQADFPDVMRCEDQKKALEQQLADMEKSEGTTSGGGSTLHQAPNPDAQRELERLKSAETNLMGQIRASVLASENKERQIGEMKQELTKAEAKVSASPMIMQKYQTLQQQNDMARDDYQKMSKSKEAAETQKSMEEHQASETLDILEQPITPDTPTSPIRGAIIGIGTLVGLIVGFALAGAKEIKNTSLKNLKDVRAYTNLPILSSIPLLENALLVRRKRRMAWLAWSTALIIGGAAMCLAVYYHVVIAGQVS